MPYERELETATVAAREAADIVRRHYEDGTRVWEKGEDDPVTQADLDADEAIQRHLGAAFPDDALLSEETECDRSRLGKARVWIIDPIDGTKEFTRKIPEFAVSIALCEDGEPIVGVVANPVTQVTLWATRGGGTFRNGERVEVSSCRRLDEAVVIASRTEISRNQLAPYEDWFADVRGVGSIAWKLAVIACGEGDLNFSVAPKNEWDVCAGDLIVREAGGIYADFEGATRRYNQPETLISGGMGAGHPTLFAQFISRLREG